MAPTFTIHDLTNGEWREVQRLLQTPALWPFAHLAGAVGFPRAVAACGKPTPMDIELALERGGFTPAQLPKQEDIRSALWACRLVHRRTRKKEPLQTTAQTLGGTLEQAHTALRVHAEFHPPTPAVKRKATIT